MIEKKFVKHLKGAELESGSESVCERDKCVYVLFASAWPRANAPFVVCTINVFRLQRKFMTSPSTAINKDAFTRSLCLQEPPTP